MIKSLTLKNIQAHKDTRLEFSPGINVIYGQSDQGKSTIVRALKELLTNSIPSDILINWDISKTKKSAEIICETDNHTIARTFGKKGNAFVLDGEVLKAPKQGMPDKVLDALNMTEVNIQTQLEDHFLLRNISSGQVAKRLNATVGLEDIDTTQQNINSIVRELESKKKLTAQELEKRQTELEKMKWLDELEKEIKRLNRLHEKKVKVDSALESLSDYKSQLSKLYKKRKAVTERLKIKSFVRDISDDIFVLSTQREQLTDIKNLEQKLTKLQAQRKSIDFSEDMKKAVNNLSVTLSQREKCQQKLASFKQLQNSLEEAWKNRKRAEKTLSNAKERLSEYKEKVEVCPLCGNVFDDGGTCERHTS